MASPTSNASLTGVLERIIFFNEENHYTIAELKPEPAFAEASSSAKATEDRTARQAPPTKNPIGTDRVTITGPLPGVQCGETLQLTGEWTRHAQHGAQFKIASFKSELPSSVYGIRKYLGSGLVPGIGKVYANKIVDTFGTDTLRVLSEESGKLRKVPGIGKMRATAIKEAWESQKVLREVHIYLQTYGVTTSQCVRIVAKFGPAAKQIITEEPYRIAREIDGIGFKTADRIAINLGYANDAAPRLDAGLIYALETLQEEGHTAFLQEDLTTHAAALLETSTEFIAARIEALVKNKSVIRHLGGAATPPRAESGEVAGSPSSFVQLPVNDRAEAKIAGAVKRLNSVPSGLPAIKIDAAVNWAQEKAGFEFHALQAAAIKNSLANKITILTGGPGTGKAQPVDSLVLTPSGFHPIGGLRPGDWVTSAEGRPVRIKSVHPQGIKPIFKITFADGRSTRSCEEHLWKIWTRTSVWSPTKKKKIRARGWRVVPLQYIRNRLDLERAESERMGIPLLQPHSEALENNLPCAPYLLGVLIGDGTIGPSLQLTTVDPFIRQRVSDLVAPWGLTLKPVTLHGVNTISYRITHTRRGVANPLSAHLRLLGLAVRSEKKFIPKTYLAASLPQRLELIRGLIDTDGTVDKLGVLSFGTSSLQLAHDFQQLAWSVGCIATLGAIKNPIYTHLGAKRNGLPAYTVFLQHPTPEILVSLPRKVARLHRSKARKRLERRLRLTAIEPAGTAECVCLSIDSPSGLYVTDNYIVTHNTTILRALVEILKAKKVRVTLAAPTGRAAQRLAGTTGGFASTIHRLLKFENGSFTVNESHPLATDFLIVDEASMLDTRLAAALLQAVPIRAHLLLVGDTDQLPSVGAGNVLKDLISSTTQLLTLNPFASHEGAGTNPEGRSSGITGHFPSPVTRLSFVYRQKEESLIVTTAHAINGGEARPPPIVDAVEKAQPWSDLNFISATSAEDCLAKIVELTTKFIPQHFKWFDPVGDVQILAPMHKGVAGVGNINTQLQAAMNPTQKGLRAISGEYRPGDKLIQLRNNYDKNLFNGDIGTIVSVDLTKGTLIADFDGEHHLFERSEFNDVALAYAISIHKSQGSEYPIVIVPLLKAHFMMLQRNLIYTAITRGRKKVFIVGEPAAYGMAVRNAESKMRCTHLREKILAI